MLMPSDILAEVYRVIASASTGKGSEPNWITAYQVLARLDANTQQQLEQERGPAGSGAGHYYGAASVVADACEMLANRGQVEISYLDARGLRMPYRGRDVEPGNPVCGIYRKRSPA